MRGLVEVFETLLGDDFILDRNGRDHPRGRHPVASRRLCPRGHVQHAGGDLPGPARPGRRLSQRHSGQPLHSVPRSAGDVGGGSVGTASRRSCPDRYPLVNEPGDVIFMNHKTFHAALGDRPWRRAIHVNAVQNATPDRAEHFEWLTGLPGPRDRSLGPALQRPAGGHRDSAPAADAGPCHRAGLRHHRPHHPPAGIAVDVCGATGTGRRCEPSAGWPCAGRHRRVGTVPASGATRSGSRGARRSVAGGPHRHRDAAGRRAE